MFQGSAILQPHQQNDTLIFFDSVGNGRHFDQEERFVHCGTKPLSYHLKRRFSEKSEQLDTAA